MWFSRFEIILLEQAVEEETRPETYFVALMNTHNLFLNWIRLSFLLLSRISVSKGKSDHNQWQMDHFSLQDKWHNFTSTACRLWHHVPTKRWKHTHNGIIISQVNMSAQYSQIFNVQYIVCKYESYMEKQCTLTQLSVLYIHSGY